MFGSFGQATIGRESNHAEDEDRDLEHHQQLLVDGGGLGVGGCISLGSFQIIPSVAFGLGLKTQHYKSTVRDELIGLRPWEICGNCLGFSVPSSTFLNGSWKCTGWPCICRGCGFPGIKTWCCPPWIATGWFPLAGTMIDWFGRLLMTIGKLLFEDIITCWFPTEDGKSKKVWGCPERCRETWESQHSSVQQNLYINCWIP